MKGEIVSFLKSLRDQIVVRFEAFEAEKRFQRQIWSHHSGGGGEISLLRGTVFEKAAVNWSGVSGKEFPLDPTLGAYFATGISLITHMHNPHAPTVHMNLRFIETEKKCWVGGGYDLTPMGFPYEEDTRRFHAIAKGTLDPFGEEIYPQFSQSAKEYFYVPHRKKERGVGGIFFDYLTIENLDLWKSIGTNFLEAILPIYERRIHQPFTAEEREQQLALRAHYVEFNLLYDRGTKFGFLSSGNPEAILCSMPPLAKW